MHLCMIYVQVASLASATVGVAPLAPATWAWWVGREGGWMDGLGLTLHVPT